MKLGCECQDTGKIPRRDLTGYRCLGCLALQRVFAMDGVGRAFFTRAATQALLQDESDERGQPGRGFPFPVSTNSDCSVGLFPHARIEPVLAESKPPVAFLLLHRTIAVTELGKPENGGIHSDTATQQPQRQPTHPRDLLTCLGLRRSACTPHFSPSQPQAPWSAHPPRRLLPPFCVSPPLPRRRFHIP